MHARKEIISNQTEFRDLISDFLKSEYKQLKKTIRDIKTQDKEILKGKASLENKALKVKESEYVNKFLISWKNINPPIYAWWDIHSKQVFKLKYSDI